MRKREIISKIFGIALVFVLIGAMLGGLPALVSKAEASPGTIYVPDDYPTIQAAVDAASPGDTIIVYPGTYNENVDVNKSVTLLGENLENTTVVGGFKVTADNVVIENFTVAGGYEWDPDGAGLGGAHKAGIYVASCDNVRISNNRIENIQGGIGGAGEGGGLGGAGGVGAGIYLSSSTGDSLTSNTINNIQGGTGGAAGDWSSGGLGGVGAGIYLSSSTGDNLTSNTIEIIQGGTGGAGGDGGGGAGGVGAGIYLSSSTGDSLTSNAINNIQGGTGGAGAGADQVGFGIYLDGDSQNNYLGTPGSGLNTLDGDPILYFYNMTGLVIENYTLTAQSNPINYGKIALINCTNCTVENNTIRNYTGMSGNSAGNFGTGAAGGVGAGIYLSSSTGDNLTSNTINNIQGGTGGTGGYDGSGGLGGVGAGIYLSSSTGDNLTSNTINNIQGGTGGAGGKYGTGGTGGVAAGIYLSSSTGDSLTSNTINNIQGGTRGSGGYHAPGGADQVGFGIYLDGGSENNYLGISGSEFNTLDGDPILYFYNMTGLVIENYTLTAQSNPTNYGKIALINCTNCRVENNTIRNYIGVSGGTGGYQGMGDAGGVGAGIYLSSSTGDNLTSNTIENIQGGIGGAGGCMSSGGTGGVGAGIYLSSSTGDNLTSNTINNIQGGTGGAGGFQAGGGTGGVGAGIYLSSSTGDNLTSNTINNIQGGTRGGGGMYGATGSDQVGFGIYLDGGSENNYLGISGSEFNTLDGDPILYFYNMTGLVIENYTLTAISNPTNYGKIALINCTNCRVENNTIGNYTGVSGGAGGYHGTGGTGGVGAGIYLSSSTGDNLTSNTLENIQGGTGGTSGRGGTGGTGGVGAGIYLSSSAGDNLTSNAINNIQGGTGGAGGNWVTGGAGGVSAGIYLKSSDNNTIRNCTSSNNSYGIYLSSSSNNLIYNNYFNNTNNAWDDGTNIWNITKTLGKNIIGGPFLGGNYWSDYTGNDIDGDGLGDTLLPYNCSGNIQNGGDYLPLVEVQELIFDMQLKAGWNMVSLPVDPGTTNPDEIFPDVGSYYLYTWNATDKKYVIPTELTPGKGYWILVFEDATQTIDGTAIDEYSLSGNAGWHMIGSLSVEAQVEVSSGDVFNQFYTWDATDKKYVLSSSLEPGRGYWLLAFTDFSAVVIPMPAP